MKYSTALLLAMATAALAMVATTADAQQLDASGNRPTKTWATKANGLKQQYNSVASTLKGPDSGKKITSWLGSEGKKAMARRKERQIKEMQDKINKLPRNHWQRRVLENKLKRMRSRKNYEERMPWGFSTAAAPGARTVSKKRSSPAGLVPFVDPPFPAAIQHGADGSVRLVRKGLTKGHGVIHKYGFQTAKPLAIPAGTKYVTFVAQIKAQAKKPVQRKTKPGMKTPPPACHKSDTAITVFHGGKPLGGLRFPKGSHGSSKYETLRLRVPVSKLSATSAPITLQAAHDHASTTKCMDHSILQLKGFKVQFHDKLPAKKTAHAGAKAKFSVSESGYDYASFDDSWDESYDDMWEDNYDEGFSVSEDAADEGDDMWEDNYDEGFSVSEDAAYDGDDMWEDMYDGDFSVEDSYDEDAAADDEYYGGDFSVEDAYDEDAADDEY
ncbi:hypothetical protein AMAG_17950 [Allomyces macrogynus ATCC 38327]|uniref:Uncharacterized protein n=1 Tax=Allomyces macrogynus (strain ATCC 38327) TaxID=578462 RepID=A0A0L0S256_ALLM3|nr:hypothetical protein AMAG_17950 [Allomyces macrogynus ATCC 38327]|eukprot:KNE56667.1 hypothetical protein AMAG_17950 [Allomyces macrogynus ATCC 38327]